MEFTALRILWDGDEDLDPDVEILGDPYTSWSGPLLSMALLGAILGHMRQNPLCMNWMILDGYGGWGSVYVGFVFSM